MTRRRELPHHRRVQSFTRQQALAEGLPDRRLGARDLERLSQGLYRYRSAPVLGWPQLFLPEPVHGLDPDSVAALVEMTRGALSHQSAAHLYRVPIPDRLSDGTLHVTGPARGRRSRRDRITGHRRPLGPADVVERYGIRVTSPERTWLDLASVLGLHEAEDLVVAGDHMVRHPWVDGSRRAPLTTPEKLRLALERIGRFKGVRLARASLPHVRVGSDSPPETRLRLALVAAGLPEPALQAPPTDGDRSGFTADLAYRQWMIAFQYDGEHHRTPYQQTMDVLRDQYFTERGWLVVRVTSHDLGNGFQRVTALVRTRAASFSGGSNPKL